MRFLEKRKLNIKIRRCKEQILEIEQKRIRSQASLMEAIVTKEVPSDKDADYFNRYTQQIDMLRDVLKGYETKLAELKLNGKTTRHTTD